MSELEPEVPAEAPAEAPAEPAAAPGMGVAVYQGLPDVQMIVAPGNEVSPSGSDQTFYEGEVVTVDGPTAIALAAGGHATAVAAEPSENGAAAEAPVEPPAEEAPAE